MNFKLLLVLVLTLAWIIQAIRNHYRKKEMERISQNTVSGVSEFYREKYAKDNVSSEESTVSEEKKKLLVSAIILDEGAMDEDVDGIRREVMRWANRNGLFSQFLEVEVMTKPELLESVLGSFKSHMFMSDSFRTVLNRLEDAEIRFIDELGSVLQVIPKTS